MGENVVVPYAPQPGSTAAGDLYADLQTRTLWLGVDLAVDPGGAVLLSDIVAIEADIDKCLVDAKAYTDTRITTRAPTVHNHTSSQITDFTAAVTAVATSLPQLQFSRGMIMMWSGSLAEIGVGGLAGWTLCDGSNGSPDLRDRFVIGAGNKPAGDKNTIATANLLTDTQGGHAHVLSGTAITIAQMPAHAHGPGNLSGYAAGNTGGISANHTHTYTYASAFTKVDNGSDAGSSPSYWFGQQSPQTGTVSSDHSHALNVAAYMNGGAVTSLGGGGTHTHTTDTVGSHVHTMSSNAVREATPYFALAFIMKL